MNDYKVVPEGLEVTIQRGSRTRILRAGKRVFNGDKVVGVSDETLAVKAGIVEPKPKPAKKETEAGDARKTS
jgi:hypothetical protein